MNDDNEEFETISWDPGGIAYYTPPPAGEGKIRRQTRAGAGLNPLEAMQLTALHNLPLSFYGLVDNQCNRKFLKRLKEEYAEMRRRGIMIEIAT